MNAAQPERETLLVEIGTLELPARLLPGLAQDFGTRVGARLIQDGWAAGESPVEIFYTPRRLAVRVQGIAAIRPGQTRIQRGPTLTQAFDASGRPLPSALGFAKSQGVDVETLTVESGRLVHHVSEPSVGLATYLPTCIEDILRNLPADREMRWATGIPPFVRPIRSVFILHGTTPVKGRVYGLDTVSHVAGHPIHHPTPVRIEHPDLYESALEAACVLLNRPGTTILRHRIWTLIREAAASWQAGSHPLPSPDTLEEVSNMVEWPQAVAGSFPPSYLELPEAVIRAVLSGQQRVIPLADPAGHLAPGFVAVVNLASCDVARVRAGEERVILPRLADAKFFFEEDRREPLDERAGVLEGIIFEKRLGHLGERRKRLMRWVDPWARTLAIDPEAAKEAASLILLDLSTTLVREFPELAGEAGSHYAALEGYPTAVVEALREAYRPRTADDRSPESPLGALLSLALRVDLLAGYFLIGEKPSGQRDPFALRRAAQGLIGILDPGPGHTGTAARPALLNLALEPLFASALDGYPAALHPQAGTAPIAAELYDFTLDRLRARYLEQGGRVDVFEAVAAVRPATLRDLRARLDALLALLTRPEMRTLAQMMKRVAHLLKKSPPKAPPGPHPDPSPVALEKAESDLIKHLTELDDRLKRALEQEQYREALETLLTLESPLAAFFDSVLVLADDESVRRRRLGLLSRIDALLRRVADLERLQVD